MAVMLRAAVYATAAVGFHAATRRAASEYPASAKAGRPLGIPFVAVLGIGWCLEGGGRGGAAIRDRDPREVFREGYAVVAAAVSDVWGQGSRWVRYQYVSLVDAISLRIMHPGYGAGFSWR